MNREPTQDAQKIIEQADSSLLELVDHVLNQGVVITGDVILGVANVDPYTLASPSCYVRPIA